MVTLWCRIHDWDTWQSYRKDRDPPPWIKVHRRIVHNRKWAMLTDCQKGQLLSIWIAAADDNGYIPEDPQIIRKMCGLDEKPDVQLFVALGFLDAPTSRRQDDVTVTSNGRHCDQPDTEAEADTEAETETASSTREGFVLDGIVRRLYGWRGEEGTDPVLIKAFEKPADRDICLEIAIERYTAEGHEYNGRQFRRFLTAVIDEQKGTDSKRPARQSGRVFDV